MYIYQSYYKKNGYIIFVYVDDILIVGNNDKMIKSIKYMLNSRFDMKDMRYTNVILGVKILRTLNGLILSQSHCVNNKDNFCVAKRLLDINLYLSKNKGESIS